MNIISLKAVMNDKTPALYWGGASQHTNAFLQGVTVIELVTPASLYFNEISGYIPPPGLRDPGYIPELDDAGINTDDDLRSLWWSAVSEGHCPCGAQPIVTEHAVPTKASEAPQRWMWCDNCCWWFRMRRIPKEEDE